MRFLHTADLHLGKRLNDVSLLDDQIDAMGQIVRMAADEKVDAVLIAGDVYQKSMPPGEAIAAFNDFVTALVQAGTKVFIISGNHDSQQRVSYFAGLVRERGVYIAEAFDGALQQVALRDAYGEVVVSMLPFIKPIVARRFFPEEEISTYQQAVEAVLRRSPIDKSKRNILLCHQFITGSETSESEELAIGGLDNIDAAIFDDFDYVALGHLHGPQRAGRDAVRYAGSILKYSFSEVNHKKSATLVDVRAKGDIAIRLVPITPKHEMREVSGFLEDLLEMDYSEDYVRVTVRDELVPPDARLTLTGVFPNMMRFAVLNSKTATEVDITIGETLEDKSIEELFIDFYRLQNNDTQPTGDHLNILREALNGLKEAYHEAD
jgi:exonuclease SbcD